MALLRSLKKFSVDELQRRRAADALVGEWFNARPHPGLLPGEKENRSPVSWNIVWRSWQEAYRANKRRERECPLLGERKQVREVVTQISAGARPLDRFNVHSLRIVTAVAFSAAKNIFPVRLACKNIIHTCASICRFQNGKLEIEAVIFPFLLQKAL